MSRLMRLALALLLNLALVGALLVVGASAHSLGALAAGSDYLADAAGLALAMAAYPLSRRYPRIHVAVALLNGGWLMVVSVVVALAAVSRLVEGAPRVHGAPVVVVSTVALVTMLLTALVLRVNANNDVDDDEILSARAVVLDALSDAAAAAGVAAAGIVITLDHALSWIDAGVALVISAVVAVHTARLLRDARLALR